MSLKKKPVADVTHDESTTAPSTDSHAEVTFDDLLVAIGATQNRDAFVRLFEYFAPRIKSFLMGGGMTAELADELAQETMLTVWQKAAGFDPQKASASTWIFTIARNKRIDALRKNARPQPDFNDPLMKQDIALPDEAISQSERNDILSQAINELPGEQADLIRKSFFEDKTHTDIAQETDIPLGTVKSRIRLALERLRHHIGDAP